MAEQERDFSFANRKIRRGRKAKKISLPKTNTKKSLSIGYLASKKAGGRFRLLFIER
ncbi:MAG TPA: hypothetical protein PLU75_01150 [Oscillospiraceae bacterium]|nr:hypothetical protein [Oscillospiraceae bacterium]HRW57852.1 hypothetical protein [Oscillospiraceae bacterium]